MISAIIALALLSCGVERWEVKTLADGFTPLYPCDGGLCTEVQQSTVSELVRLPAPPWGDHAPREDAERVLVQVEANITGFKIEEDEDIHVVVADLDIPSREQRSWNTMVVEFPSRNCTADARLVAARAALSRLLPHRPRGRYRELERPIPVRLVGVVFFDRIHGQTGGAPNGIELHPVLSVELVQRE